MLAVDSSVLVAALMVSHEKHLAALSWLESAASGTLTLIVCQQSIAEVYATLTTMPGASRVPPPVAWQLIVGLTEMVTVVELKPDDYVDAVSRLATLGVLGGAIYDCLILIAAENSGAEKFVTGNRRHFHRQPQRRPVEIISI
ncbi:MAG: PIN domain-containing protein [Fimbriimonadaceae bacterium]|nr:PIN domain-containing protein [Fimbriimonadaceae bacterium]